MSKEITVKGYTISKEKPMVCVPVMGKTKEAIIEEAVKAIDSGANMIEFRADYFEGLSDGFKLQEVLSELKKLCAETILLFTVRSAREGGQSRASQREIENIILRVAESGACDLIDVEFYESEDPSALIRKIHGCNTQVVASFHNFEETPDENKLSRLLNGMADGNADVCKIAVMPKTFNDVLRLMKVSYEFDRTSDKPVIAISMTELGELSRIGCRFTGSVVTFASVGKSSAPGQINLDSMNKILELL